MEGGRLLGHGTYGCVFQPPLLCKSKSKVNQKKVGKVTVEADADNEVKISNRLRKVPLASNYFLLNDPEVCELAPESRQSEKNLALCPSFTRENNLRIPFEDAREIFAPFGGTTRFFNVLNTTNLHPKQFDFFSFFQHVLEAGATMAIAGVVHFDLHPNNFLVDDVGVVRILDFGFSFLADEITKDVIDDKWKALYFGGEKSAPHPSITNMEAPEVTIVNAIRNNMEPNQAIEAIVSMKAIFGDMEKYLGISKAKSREELTRFWATSEAAQNFDYVKLFKLYWPGFDAWGIGCIIMYVLKKVILFSEFTKGQWSQRQAAVYVAMRGLLDPNPKTRMDCVEALAAYDPNSDWIQRFGQKWLAAKQAQRKAAVAQI